MRSGITVNAETAQRALPTLARARDMLSEPGAWIQDAGRQVWQGELVNPYNGEARKWDLNFALGRAARDVGDRYDGYAATLWTLSPMLRGRGWDPGPEQWWGTIPTWNDAPGRTQDEVIELLDEAIRECERIVNERPCRACREAEGKRRAGRQQLRAGQ